MHNHTDPDGELPRANRYEGVPCPVCGAEFGTLAMLERHSWRCGKSSRHANRVWEELILQAQAKRMAEGR